MVRYQLNQFWMKENWKLRRLSIHYLLFVQLIIYNTFSKQNL